MASLEVPVQVRVSDNILQAQGQLQQKPKAVKTSNDEKVHQVLQLMIPMTEQFAHTCTGARARVYGMSTMAQLSRGAHLLALV